VLDTETMQRIMIDVGLGRPGPPDESEEERAFRASVEKELREAQADAEDDVGLVHGVP
jgi:hypothetical protein